MDTEDVRGFNARTYDYDATSPVGMPSKDRYEKLIKYIKKDQRVLDLGCGDGYLMKEAIKLGARPEGVDISRSALEISKEEGLHVYNLNLMDKWSKDINKKYDQVICGEIIEHIFDTDRLLQEIRKVLVDGGLLTISTPNAASLGRRFLMLLGISPILETTSRKRDAGHIRYFTFDTLRKLLEENGFQTFDEASTVINFDMGGRFKLRFLANIFPTLGSTIIIYTKKM